MADEILTSPDPEQMIRDMAETLARNKREKIVDAIRISNAIEAIESHPKDMGAGLASLLGKDVTGKADYANVDFMQKVYTKRFLAEWSNGLEMKIGYFHNTMTLQELARCRRMNGLIT